MYKSHAHHGNEAAIVVKEGWLKKKATNSAIAGWLNRFVILKTDGTLQYGKQEPQVNGVPLGKKKNTLRRKKKNQDSLKGILLTSTSSAVEYSKGTPVAETDADQFDINAAIKTANSGGSTSSITNSSNKFVVFGKSHRKLVFAAENGTEGAAWIACIQKVIDDVTKMKAQGRRVDMEAYANNKKIRNIGGNPTSPRMGAKVHDAGWNMRIGEGKEARDCFLIQDTWELIELSDRRKPVAQQVRTKATLEMLV